MGSIVVTVVALTIAVWLLKPRRRAVDSAGVTLRKDAAGRLLDSTVAFLPESRADWGRAMVGELDRLSRRGERWRFVAGCVGATLLVSPRRSDSGPIVVLLVAVAAIASAGVVAYGLVRYPGVIVGGRTWAVLGFFAVVLAGLVGATAVAARRGAADRIGLAGGLGVAAVWAIVGVVVVGHGSQPAFALLLLALPLAALAVGVIGASRGRSAAAGQQAALISAIVAGLVLFLVLAGETLSTANGPYDAGQLRDFAGSGLPDLATYKVSDDLGTAMSLLLLVTTVTAAIGWVSATLTAKVRRA